ncbi:tetratricopeptide repeat protein [Desulfospira joergensenii]|uniref:tetratricopeptide repeat protein n=1 Tax=Desulfospira joergensenii TaxID=53329 RepID=UPI0003B42F03|nr:tetratricopeptide repeat protein [Desulfospira joergensenii]
MNIYKTGIALLLSFLLISGCVSSSQKQAPAKSKTEQAVLVQDHIVRGEALELDGLYTQALEQYELALTVDPKDEVAAGHRKKVLAVLWNLAQDHYNKGLALDEQGKYEAARKEYLSALQNWPDHKEARAKLTPGGVSEETDKYIVHELAYGESVSILGKIYYGDFKTYPIIGKFNNLEDVTKVRVGQKLKIPVIQGFTLSTLKARHQEYLKSLETQAEDNAYQEALEIQAEKPPPRDETIKTEPEPQEMAAPEEVEEEPDKAAAEEEAVLTEEEAVPEEKAAPEEPAEEEAVVQEPAPPSSYDQALEFFNSKKYAQAIPLFETAQKEDPQSQDIRSLLFDSHFQQGLAQFNREEYLEAKASFESALVQDSSCEKCPGYIEKCESTYKEKHYNLGIHYFGKEQLEKAIKEWKMVKEIDPEYKDVAPNLKKAELLYKRLETIKQGSQE